MKTVISRLLLPLLFWPCFLQAGEAVSFLSVRDIVSGWTQDQHLWTSGNVHVTAANLGELEAWLDENGKNWTVVLIESSRNQQYQGRSGMDAVEYALGKGLSNETTFSTLTDSRTGETNGAVFVLFLEERKFSYFASDAQDKRGLGESQWIGRLDGPAIQAMRTGGRVVDAVKNTVTSIEKALTKALEREVQQARIAELEKQKAIDETRKLATRLQVTISETGKRVDKFHREHPEVRGPIAVPEVSGWTASLKQIEGLINANEVKRALLEVRSTDEQVIEFNRLLTEWESAPARFEALEKELKAFPGIGGTEVIAGHRSLADDALRSARANHALGEPLFQTQLLQAERTLADAADLYADWKKSEALRVKIRRAVILLSLLALLIILLVSNRLRRPAKKEAEALYTTWKESLRGKFEELFQLMDRVRMLVGARLDFDQRGFTGSTETLAREAIRNVDHLFIMSSATDRILGEVEQLLVPHGLFARIVNLVSPRRYQHAIRLLGTESIGFDATAGLEAILNPTKASETSHRLLGKVEDYEPFQLSFDSLIRAYDERQDAAKAQIHRLEGGIDGLPLDQQTLSARVETLSDRADKLSIEASHDLLFPLDSVRATLLPTAADSLAQAATLGQHDPVESFETILPTSTRLVDESDQIITVVERFRRRDLPRIIVGNRHLLDLGRQVNWIQKELEAFEERSESLARKTAKFPAAEAISALSDDLLALTGQVMSCVELTERARGPLTARIEAIRVQLATARGDLSQSLGLSPEAFLVEENLSPDQNIEAATHGITGAIASIDRGEPAAAASQLDISDRNLEEADKIIRLSLTAAREHPERIALLRLEREALSEHLPTSSSKLEELKSCYAPAVLLISAPYGEQVNGNESVLGCIEQAEKRLNQAMIEFRASDVAFSKGQLIRSLGLLETIANELGFARHQLALVDEQHETLKTAESAVAPELESARTQARDLGILAKDRRSSASTRQELESALQQISLLTTEAAAGGEDPFVRLRRSHEVRLSLNAVNDGIRADWKAHEMCDAASTGARAALLFCNSYLREAQTDGIPDSRVLSRAIQRHAELTTELDHCSDQLTREHLEWPDLFSKINVLTGDIAKVKSTLAEELAAAKNAADQVSLAADNISELHRWRSRHSVNLDRGAGRNELSRAKSQLATGNYAESRQEAIASLGASTYELQKAKTEESAKIQALAAAASLAASQRRRSFSSSGNSFSSHSSSSSGFSRSSFSSGSGFSRSGW